MRVDPRHKSRMLLDGPDRAAARAYFKAIGFTDEDLARPLVGVAHCWIEMTPCNLNHRKLAEKVKEGIRAAGGTPIEFNTISITDGIAMGTEGMKASLVSREVDRRLGRAGRARPPARRPGRHLRLRQDDPGDGHGDGPAQPARPHALRRLDRVRRVPGPAPHRSRTSSRPSAPTTPARSTAESCTPIESRACPGAGACGGQFTANTMSTAFEMLGISPMGFNGVPATDPRKEEVAFETGRAGHGRCSARG